MYNRRNFLEKRINNLRTVFDFNKILSLKSNLASVAKYYSINRIPYSVFHNKIGFIHAAISRDGIYRREDLLEQAKIVEGYFAGKTKKVLELAVGRGANSWYLAKKYKDIKFYGIDLSGGQLDYAVKKARGIKNFFVTDGDFHNLEKFATNTTDVVFIIEALCHSSNKIRVLKEANRVLKKGGKLIIIDGYTKKTSNALSTIEKLAIGLTEKGMMVAKFEYYHDFKNMIKKSGFKIIHEEDDSKLIMPSLVRFEKLAAKFLSLPLFLRKLIIKLLPSEFTNNTVSGYLMPVLVDSKIACYMVTIAEKK